MVTINGLTGRNSSYWKYYLVVTEQDVNISSNTSKVKVEVYLGATSYSRAVRGNITATHTVTIDGTNYTFTTGAYTIEKNTNILLGSVISNPIPHNADGSKNISVSANSPDLAQASGYGPYSGSASGTVTLTTIPRASSVTCADGNIGSSTTININRASSNFKHTLRYSFGSLTGTIVEKTSEVSYGWNIPTSFYTQIPNNSIGQGGIYCDTYDGNNLIGTTMCYFRAFVINSNPTITATIVDTNETTKALTGDENKLIKYFSNAKVTITATAKNSATIKSQKVTCGDGKSSTSLTSTLNEVESGTFNLTCTDSRGLVGTNTVTKAMIDYIKLAITSLTIARQSSTSNTVNINLKGNYFNNTFGSVRNALTLKWRYRLKNGTWSGYTTIIPVLNGNTFSYSGKLGTEFNYQKAYEIEVVAQDKLITNTITREVTEGIPLIDIWKNNVGINGIIKSNSIKNTNIVDENNNFIKNLKNSFFLGVLVSGWKYIGDFEFSNQGQYAVIDCYFGEGQNGEPEQNTHVRILLKQGWTGESLPIGVTAQFTQNYQSEFKVKISHLSTMKCALYVYLPWNYNDFTYSLNGSYVSFTQKNSEVSSEPTTDKEATYFKNYNPITLYENSSGTTGTVTLSKSSADFTYLEIFGVTNSGENISQKVFSPNGKNFNLSGGYLANATTWQNVNARYNISGTSITKEYEYYINNGASNDIGKTENYIYITRVDGYK